MSNTAQAVDIGRYFGSVEAKGSIRDVKIFNRELTASEIAELARGNDLGFSEEWGGAYGGVYTQDATPSGEWEAQAGSVSDEAGPIVGKSNVLGYTVDTTLASHYARLTSVFTAGKKYRVSFDYLVDAANDVVTSLRIYDGSFYAGAFTPTAGTWNRVTVELTPTISNLRIYPTVGTTTSIQDPAGDDKLYIDGLTITEIGTLADFRAENYDPDSLTLADISDNAFIGTNNGATFVGNGLPPHAATRQQLAETNALKTTAPSMYFNGSSSVVTVADDDRFSFTDSVNDLPFSVSAFVNMTDASSFPIINKYSASPGEWYLVVNGSDKLELTVQSTADSTYRSLTSDGALTSYEGDWVHLAATYAGSGASAASGVAFANADQAMTLYVNGIAVSATGSGSVFTGMANSSQPVRIGRSIGTYGKGSIRDVKIFNRTLTSTEVAQLARGNDLGFSEEWGGALGGVFTQDATPSGEFAGVYLTDADEAGPIGGKSNILKLTVNTASGVLHYATFSGASGTAGKRLRLKCYAYVPSANSNTDGIWIYQSSGSGKQEQSITPDTWVPLEFEFVSNGNVMVVAMLDGTSSSFADAGSDDILYLADLTVTQIGTLADFRSERYDTSTSKLYDNSDNAFVGTGTSVSLTGREVPVYETGTWTPSLYFSGTSEATYSVQDGYYSRIGDTVYIRGSITLSGIGASSGEVSVAGLPLQPSGNGASSSVVPVHMTSALNLTSSPTGLVEDGVSQILLYDAGATGQTALDETNFGASTVLKIAGTYKIQ